MIWLIIFLSFMALLLIGAYIAYRMAFYMPKSARNKTLSLPKNEAGQAAGKIIEDLIVEMEQLPAQEVYIKSFDGTTLFGRYYHVADNAPLQIQFHGYKGSAFRDFCGGNKLAREMGHNTLLVDQRAHGKSGSSTICFGVRERYDCKKWVEYAVNRFGSDIKILLSGVSMGAATVIMASDLDLPSNVKGVIADCPYSCPKQIIKKVCREDMHLPNALCFFAFWGAFIFGKGLRLNSSALKSAKNTKLPILILHGEADGFVPCQMSNDIKNIAPETVTLHTFEGADHGFSFIADAERYKGHINDFLKKCLK